VKYWAQAAEEFPGVPEGDMLRKNIHESPEPVVGCLGVGSLSKFLSPALNILILMCASTPNIQGRNRVRYVASRNMWRPAGNMHWNQPSGDSGQHIHWRNGSGIALGLRPTNRYDAERRQQDTGTTFRT
jgi:hypothetical protein